MPGAYGRVLVVDDNKVIRQLIRVNLELEGFEVVTAADGAECLDVVRQVRPDVVTLDVVMPRLDGISAAARLRADPWTRDVRIAVVSACTPADVDRGAAAGVDAFVAKPFEPGELVAVVRRLMGESRRTTAAEPGRAGAAAAVEAPGAAEAAAAEAAVGVAAAAGVAAAVETAAAGAAVAPGTAVAFRAAVAPGTVGATVAAGTVVASGTAGAAVASGAAVAPGAASGARQDRRGAEHAGLDVHRPRCAQADPDHLLPTDAGGLEAAVATVEAAAEPDAGASPAASPAVRQVSAGGAVRRASVRGAVRRASAGASGS